MPSIIYISASIEKDGMKLISFLPLRLVTFSPCHEPGGNCDPRSSEGSGELQ